MEDKSCKECNLCCYFTEVPELKKPVLVLCKFCNSNKGCKIYKDRPSSCRNFKCVWYQCPNMSDDLRPDKCHVMFEKLPTKNIYLALVDPKFPDSWKNENVTELITTIINLGNSVIVSSTEKHMFLQKNKTANEVLKEISSFVSSIQGNKGWPLPHTQQT